MNIKLFDMYHNETEDAFSNRVNDWINKSEIEVLDIKLTTNLDDINKVMDVMVTYRTDKLNDMLNVNSEGLKVIKFIGNSMYPIVSQLNQFFNSNNVNIIKIEHLVDECYVYYKEIKS